MICSSNVLNNLQVDIIQQYRQRFEINEIPVPKIGDNDVLVKVGAAGWCHTDYQVWEGVYQSPFPTILSHEPAGTIVTVGPKAQEKWNIGQRVVFSFIKHQCHNCTSCKVTAIFDGVITKN